MAFLEYSPIAPLFHYTSYEAFKNILESRTFWLSDLQESNDPRELNLPKQGIISALKRFDRLQIPPEGREILRLVTFDLIRSIKMQRLYTICFTPRRDSLTFWKEYTDKGKGLSFSIRPRALRDMYGRIQKVSYVGNIKNTYFDTIIETQLEKLRFINSENFEFEQRIIITTAFLSAIYATKHKSWKHEREVRVTFASSERNEDNKSYPLAEYPDGTIVPHRIPLTRQADEKDIEYYSISFGRYQDGEYNNSRAFDEVVVGPNCEKSVSDIDDLLRSLGYKDVVVSQSSCMFR